MAHPMPVSAREIYEFRPATDALKRAREALESARKKVAEAGADDDAEALLITEEAAEAALKLAEEARAQDDPVFRLRVPNGRTDTLVACDIQCDLDLPQMASTDQIIRDALDEADHVGMPVEDRDRLLAALDTLEESGSASAELWGELFPIIRSTPTGRADLARNICASELLARHRIRHYLVLDGKCSPLTDADIDRYAPYLGQIHARIVEMSAVSRDDAKN